MSEVLKPSSQSEPIIEVLSFANLELKELAGYYDRANWMVALPDGTKRGDWLYLEDQGYRVRINHTQVRWDANTFDKFNLLGWGAFVLPMRVTPDKIAEFCIPKERRILLRDEQGAQGGVFTYNIPQGVIRSGESTIEASIRETSEETGREIVDILLMGKSGYDIANSEALQDLFLALVPYDVTLGAQSLEDTEEIEEKWHTWRELGRFNLEDCRTEAALYKASRILYPQLWIPELTGRFEFDPRFTMTQQESLEWYVRPELYQQLKAETLPNFPHSYHQL